LPPKFVFMNEIRLLGVVEFPASVVVAVPSGTRLHVIVAGTPFVVRVPLAVVVQVTVDVESKMKAWAGRHAKIANGASQANSNPCRRIAPKQAVADVGEARTLSCSLEG
jgi:hypothetical protein